MRTNIASAWMIRALTEAPIPHTKLKTLAERIYDGCDEEDGLRDGLIDDPRKCDFTPSRDLPKCFRRLGSERLLHNEADRCPRKESTLMSRAKANPFPWPTRGL